MSSILHVCFPCSIHMRSFVFWHPTRTIQVLTVVVSYAYTIQTCCLRAAGRSLNLRVGGVIATVAMVYRNLHESRRRAYVIVDDCGYCNGTMINRVHQVENKRALVSNLGCWNQGSECSSTDIGCGPKFCKDALLE